VKFTKRFKKRLVERATFSELMFEKMEAAGQTRTIWLCSVRKTYALPTVWGVLSCEIIPDQMIDPTNALHITWDNTGYLRCATGRAIAQAVSRRPGSGHMGFVVGKAALGQLFSEYFGLSCQAFHRLLHTHHSSSTGTGTMGHLVASVIEGCVPLPKTHTHTQRCATSSMIYLAIRVTPANWVWNIFEIASSSDTDEGRVTSSLESY
jgi:hypothetical protein